MAEPTQGTKFQIFRAADAKTLEEAGVMTLREFTPVQSEGFSAMRVPALARGSEARVLFNVPGFSLVYSWFKKGFPLPLHSHDSDCLYYIISGTLRLGTTELGSGDGFFVPRNAPYSYTPGEDGVEVLEFRHETHFDFNLLAKSEAFWKKSLDVVVRNSDDWRVARKPARNG